MNFYLTTNKYAQSIGILHFGIGLIGTTIQKRCLTNGVLEKVELSTHPFDWKFPDKTHLYLNQFFEEKKQVLAKIHKLYIIWSAGKAGFNATDEVVDAQLTHFKLTVNVLTSYVEHTGIPLAFFLMSSAGGLFEGQPLIDKKAVPSFKRAYGRLKLAEEEIILNHSLSFEKNIFRISSVYSVDVFDKRKGLMLVLMENGLKHRVSTIIGQEKTLRDYVLDRDIADYLIHLIYTNTNPGPINYLVSSKPSSIFEIRKNVEKILKKRIYINYSAVSSNAANMSYEKTIIAKGFKATNFKTNLRELYLNLTK